MPETTTNEAGARRLLGRRRELSDQELATRVAAGDAIAFAQIVTRHQAKLLSFCRHTLVNADEAEDALQQTFINAHSALSSKGPPRELLPWLYAIARNCCHDIWSKRRNEVQLPADLPLAGLSDPVVEREDLRELLVDLADLPEQQRSALLLAELEGMPHSAIAAVVGCEETKVRALIYQARATLIAERDAREESCLAIREQLSVARGGELRRGPLRRHLRRCEGCRCFADDVAEQRSALRLVLPVVPSALFLHELFSHVGIAAADTAAIAGAGAAGGAIAGGSAVGSGAGAAGAGGGAAGSAAGAAVLAKGAAILVAGAVVIGGVGIVASSSGSKPQTAAVQAAGVVTNVSPPTATTPSATSASSTAPAAAKTTASTKTATAPTVSSTPAVSPTRLTPATQSPTVAQQRSAAAAHAAKLARAAAVRRRAQALAKAQRDKRLAALAIKRAAARKRKEAAAISAIAAKRATSTAAAGVTRAAVASPTSTRRAASPAAGALKTIAADRAAANPATTISTATSTATTGTKATSTATSTTTASTAVTPLRTRAGARAVARSGRRG